MSPVYPILSGNHSPKISLYLTYRYVTIKLVRYCRFSALLNGPPSNDGGCISSSSVESLISLQAPYAWEPSMNIYIVSWR